MARLHAADPAAWTEMVRLHGSALHRYLTSLGAVHVDDLVQEVFLRALSAVQRGVGAPTSALAVRPWLIVIARHLQRDSIRRDRVRVTIAIDGAIALPSTQPSALDAMQQQEEIERVRRAMASLPAHLAETLALKLHAGLSYAQIADVLGIARGTVGSRLNEALALLTKTLKQEPSR